MKKVERKSVFETNSSSSHSFSIRKDVLNLDYPRVIHFKLGEFGWSTDEEMYSFEGRCNYLYTCAAKFEFIPEFKKMIEKIMPKVDKDGFEVRIDYEKIPKNDDWDWHIIDHQSIDQAYCMIHDLLLDENLFKNFLFDDETEAFIVSDCEDIELKQENRYVMDWRKGYEMWKQRGEKY